VGVRVAVFGFLLKSFACFVAYTAMFRSFLKFWQHLIIHKNGLVDRNSSWFIGSLAHWLIGSSVRLVLVCPRCVVGVLNYCLDLSILILFIFEISYKCILDS
jgi:hypothetical protein